MRVYILGAGASFHAGYPLASRLGVCLAEWVGTLPPDHSHREPFAQLHTTYGTLDEFEPIMTDLFLNTPGSRASALPIGARANILTAIQEATREYFDSIRPRPALLYDELAQRTRAGDFVISFNYDLGAERSLQAAGLWHINDGYGFRLTPDGNTSPVRVLKLHGSTNWRGLLFGGSTGFGAARDSLGERPVLCFRQDFSYLGFPDVVDPQYGQLPSAASVTAMIMPTLKKRFFHETTFGKEWEPFWNTLWSQAKDALRRADEIVLVGYSMPAADERARELVFASPNKNIRVTVCCHRATSGIAQEFRDHGFTNIHEPTSPTFEGWLAPNAPAQQEIIREEARNVIATLRKQHGAGEELAKGTSWFFASIGYPNRPLRARERVQIQRRLNKITEQLIPYDIALNALSGRISPPAASYALLDGMLRTLFRAVNVDMTAEPDAIEAFQRQVAHFTTVSLEVCAREGFPAIAADRDALITHLALAPRPERLESILQHWYDSGDCHNFLQTMTQYQVRATKHVTTRPKRYTTATIHRLVDQYHQHAILLTRQLRLLLALNLTAAGHKRVLHTDIQEKNLASRLQHHSVCPALRNLANARDAHIRNAIAHSTPEIRLDLRTCTFNDEHQSLTLTFDELYDVVNRLTITATILIGVPFALQQLWINQRLAQTFKKS